MLKIKEGASKNYKHVDVTIKISKCGATFVSPKFPVSKFGEIKLLYFLKYSNGR